MSLAAAFRHARTQTGLSQRELAARAGVSSSLVTRLERDGANPSWRTLVRIAAAMQRRPELRLVPDENAVASAEAALGGSTPIERLRNQRVNILRAIATFADAGVPFVVSGVVAALLQGFPTPADELHVIIHDTDDALMRLQRVLRAEQVLFREIALEELRSIVQRAWAIGDCDVTITLVAELPAAVTVELTPHYSVQVVPPATLLADEEVASMLEIVAVRSSTL